MDTGKERGDAEVYAQRLSSSFDACPLRNYYLRSRG